MQALLDKAHRDLSNLTPTEFEATWKLYVPWIFNKLAEIGAAVEHLHRSDVGIAALNTGYAGATLMRSGKPDNNSLLGVYNLLEMVEEYLNIAYFHTLGLLEVHWAGEWPQRDWRIVLLVDSAEAVREQMMRLPRNGEPASGEAFFKALFNDIWKDLQRLEKQFGQSAAAPAIKPSQN